MVDLPAYFPYLSNRGFTIFFWATIYKEQDKQNVWPWALSGKQQYIEIWAFAITNKYESFTASGAANIHHLPIKTKGGMF